MPDPQSFIWQDPQAMLPLVQGRVGERELRLFACACCRRVWRLLDDGNRRIVEAAEQFALGQLPSAELSELAQGVSGADAEAERRAVEDHLASARYEAATAAWQCAVLPAADAAWFASRCAAAAAADELAPDPASESWRSIEQAERAAQGELLRALHRNLV
jgi:hypothetical protein